MSKAQFEALAKRVDAQDARITKLEEKNTELKEQLAALKKEPKKKSAKTTTVKVEKAKAGAGAPDEEVPARKLKKSEMNEIQKIEYEIALSEKYIADESKPEENRKKRSKQLETERAKLRKLNGETAPDDTEEESPVELPIEELQELLNLEVGSTPGIYRDADGRFVTGPPEDPSEEFVNTKFNGIMYGVGKKTFRICQGAASNSFKGYAGVANFKEMMQEESSDSE